MKTMGTIKEPDYQMFLFQSRLDEMPKSVRQFPIDESFDAEFANQLAKFESYNKHLYRPNTYLHKWWARRCGTTFRLILKHLVTNKTQTDFYSPEGLGGKIILDPMMGGGTTVHEAIRLGANVVGADIDPIPILQLRASLTEIPLPELKRAFHNFLNELSEELSHLYRTLCPTCDLAYELKFVLYGLRRQCHCGEAVFIDSIILRHNSDDTVLHICPQTKSIYLDDTLISEYCGNSNFRLLEKSEKRCEKCQTDYDDILDIPYFKRYVPLVIVGECKEHGLFFRSPDANDIDMINHVNLKREHSAFQARDFQIDPGPKSQSLVSRGITSYLDLFSSRQLVFLEKAIEKLKSIEDSAIRLNLGLLLSTCLEFNSLLCGYKGSKKNRPGAIRHTFAHHAYSFPYTALENNPIYKAKASGTLFNLFHSRIVKGRTWAEKPIERVVSNKKVKKVAVKGETDFGTQVESFDQLESGSKQFLLYQGSSISLNLPDNSIDFVVTDPPYFDSVQYSDLAAFFRVWLKQIFPCDVNWEYSLDEAAVDQHANGNGQYTTILTGIFQECSRVLKKDNGRLIFTFHHWNPKGWSALTNALKDSRYQLVNYYVVHAENPVSVHIANQNALTHDVILILRAEDSSNKSVWEVPDNLKWADSYSFCEACGQILGWMLQSKFPTREIDKLWQELLQNNDA